VSAFFAFLHHLAAFILFGALMVQFVTLRDELAPRTVRRLQLADIALGVSGSALLLVGLLRVFYFEKGAAYYWANGAFLAKFSLFILVALLSIYPTAKIIAWRRNPAAGGARAVKAIVHVELAAVVLLMLLGAMMARGIGS
jgi:putative membrane protein